MNVSEYTQNELEKELILLDLHLRQHPLCIGCVQKSLYTIEGFAEEGIKFLPDKTSELQELINWIQKYQSEINVGYHDIIKQLLLLEIHLHDFVKFQTNKDILFCKDCLQKHLLLLEKLTEGNIIVEASGINLLVTEILKDLNGLTVEAVEKYLLKLNIIIYNILDNMDLSILNLTRVEISNMIQSVDGFRRDFLAPEKCFKCQALKLGEEQHL